jgi:arsenate reductase (thioredoxin)
MNTVIFACVHNAGRSQIAASWFQHMSDPSRARAISAGTQPADRVHPVVVDAMAEVGIDLRAARPQRLTLELARSATMLITMACGDQCPVVPGLRREDWILMDPKDRPLTEVRVIRDAIESRVRTLLQREKWLAQFS